MADLSKELNKELNKDFAYCEDALGRAENAIGNLPSAQPEKRTEKRTETHACDCIDRQAAIDALGERPIVWTDDNQYALGERNQYDIDRLAIETLPSAQTELIRCKDCKWYGRADKRRFYRGMDCLQKRIDTIVPDKDFCSRAERRTDGSD